MARQSCSPIQTCNTSQGKHTAQAPESQPTGQVICLTRNHQLHAKHTSWG
uniref:Uncharacterized protein n=1 Tax=Setaria italica TaxID=4555 RepID=K3XP99_SETIT